MRRSELKVTPLSTDESSPSSAYKFRKRDAFVGAQMLFIAVSSPASLSAADFPAAAASPDSGFIPAKVLEQRRSALLELLEPGIALLRSAESMSFRRTGFSRAGKMFFSDPGSSPWAVPTSTTTIRIRPGT